MRARIAAALLALLVAAPARGEGFTFAAFGNMPFRAEDEARVDALVAAINRRAPAFTIFLGDAKSSREACTEELLVQRPRRIFAGFDGAVVATPGDNEWTDCRPHGPGESAPAEALDRLREAFHGGPMSFGGRPIRLVRQGGGRGPFPDMVENARWSHAGVVFATLDLPGIPRPDVPGARQVHPEALPILPRLAAAAAAWVDATFEEALRRRARAVVFAFQADLWHPCHMATTLYCRSRPAAWGGEVGRRLVRDLPYDIGTILDRLAAGAAAFRRPVLLLHGEGHRYLVQAWPSDGRGGTIPYATRIMVPGGSDIRALLVTAAPEARLPWQVALVPP